MSIGEILSEINRMEEYDDLMAVLDAATMQWNRMFPDWEIVTMSVPRNDPDEKKRLIRLAFKFIDDEKRGKGL